MITLAWFFSEVKRNEVFVMVFISISGLVFQLKGVRATNAKIHSIFTFGNVKCHRIFAFENVKPSCTPTMRHTPSHSTRRMSLDTASSVLRHRVECPLTTRRMGTCTASNEHLPRSTLRQKCQGFTLIASMYLIFSEEDPVNPLSKASQGFTRVHAWHWFQLQVDMLKSKTALLQFS